MSDRLEPKTAAWLDQVKEEIIDPGRRIIDPHHHLWSEPLAFGRYELADLWADTGSGHNIEKPYSSTVMPIIALMAQGV
ncbi:MAG: hypothetical protein CM15mP120_00330 [Pseudomonadota bacterium]|nr:MAG: hypothetical protein CM15mP120_00330 [Pseudomonadota bacterium]